MLTLKEQLKSLLKGDVLDDEESLRVASRDASIFELRPQVVVAPRDVEDLKTLVSFVLRRNKEEKSRSQSDRGSSISEKKSGLSLTARSGGTDMSGGALTESIVVDFKKYLNKIGKVSGDTVVTQPGAYYRDFEKETLKHDRLMPSYPASREICTVGGMAANNSGGEKSLTYGQTKDYIARLKVILADGNEYVVEPLARNALDHKMQQQDFEGELYRKVFKLVDENYALVKSARPKVSKNSAGYQAWDVWDKEKGTFDLSKLFVGAQGTLGLITEVTFKLVKPKKYSSLLVIFLKDLARVPKIAQAILAQKPESFESYDDKTLWLALKYLPEFINFLGAKSILSLGLQFLPEVWMAISGGIPKMVLMAEFTGDTQKEALAKAQRAQAALKPMALKMRIAPTEQSAKKYWTIRRESFNLLRRHLRNKQTAPFIDDIIVRPEYLPEFMPKLEAILKPYKLTYSIVGHIGNGNFHIIPLMNLADPRTKQIIPEISRKVYDLVLHYHGSITAEHNDGMIRSPFLKQMFGDRMYSIFEEIKAIFDPDGIFNPGKKVNSNFEYAMRHLKDEHTSYHW